MVDIFCKTHIDPPTSSANNATGCAKSNPKNVLFNGTAVSKNSNESYICEVKLAKFSGKVGISAYIHQYKLIHIGIWITNGPKQPKGLIPSSL